LAVEKDRHKQTKDASGLGKRKSSQLTKQLILGKGQYFGEEQLMKYFSNEYKDPKIPYSTYCDNLDTFVLIFDTQILQDQLKKERPVLREIAACYKTKMPGFKDAKPHFNELYNKIAAQKDFAENVQP